jgi:hypothetical protein
LAPQNKENTMLTKFTAALVATSLIASAAFAAQSPGNSGSMPAAQASQPANPTKTATTHKTVKVAKHRSTHARKHLASGKERGKIRMERHARHTTSAKTHQAGVAKTAKHS